MNWVQCLKAKENKTLQPQIPYLDFQIKLLSIRIYSFHKFKVQHKCDHTHL
jgi:hypothetical protein